MQSTCIKKRTCGWTGTLGGRRRLDGPGEPRGQAGLDGLGEPRGQARLYGSIVTTV
jgi:hypothetical protein